MLDELEPSVGRHVAENYRGVELEERRDASGMVRRCGSAEQKPLSEFFDECRKAEAIRRDCKDGDVVAVWCHRPSKHCGTTHRDEDSATWGTVDDLSGTTVMRG